MPTSGTLTQELLAWKPTHPGLAEDLGQGHSFICPAQDSRRPSTVEAPAQGRGCTTNTEKLPRAITAAATLP
jgi:hypothetical protein